MCAASLTEPYPPLARATYHIGHCKDIWRLGVNWQEGILLAKLAFMNRVRVMESKDVLKVCRYVHTYVLYETVIVNFFFSILIKAILLDALAIY